MSLTSSPNPSVVGQSVTLLLPNIPCSEHQIVFGDAFSVSSQLGDTCNVSHAYADTGVYSIAVNGPSSTYIINHRVDRSDTKILFNPNQLIHNKMKKTVESQQLQIKVASQFNTVPTGIVKVKSNYDFIDISHDNVLKDGISTVKVSIVKTNIEGGSYPITVSYGGDKHHKPSTSQISLIVFNPTEIGYRDVVNEKISDICKKSGNYDILELVRWDRYQDVNAIWGLVPTSGSEADMPEGTKYYGKFNTVEECESACMKDQPFCHAWTLYPKRVGTSDIPFSQACYGRDDSYFTAQKQEGIISGVKRYPSELGQARRGEMPELPMARPVTVQPVTAPPVAEPQEPVELPTIYAYQGYQYQPNLPSEGLINEYMYIPVEDRSIAEPEQNLQEWSVSLCMRRMRELHKEGKLDYDVSNFTTANAPEGATCQIGMNVELSPDLSNCDAKCTAPNNEDYYLITNFPLKGIVPSSILNPDDTLTSPSITQPNQIEGFNGTSCNLTNTLFNMSYLSFCFIVIILVVTMLINTLSR